MQDTPDKSIFPSPLEADENGIVAFSFHIHVNMLKDAYRHGIFPWPCEERTILWAAPRMRGVLPLEEVHIPDRLKRDMKKYEQKFDFRIDTAFSEVIRACAASPRPEQEGTWITSKIIQGYEAFYKAGYVHSFEAFSRETGKLAGGLYGVSVGKIFCGESMFYRESGASKFAFVKMTECLKKLGVELLDTQMVTNATMYFGAREIPSEDYLKQLKRLGGPPLDFSVFKGTPQN